MSKQFVKGNVYVFTKKKYMEVSCKDHPKSIVNDNSKQWINKANGNIVIPFGLFGAMVRGLYISPEWCKCIKINNSKIESEEI